MVPKVAGRKHDRRRDARRNRPNRQEHGKVQPTGTREGDRNEQDVPDDGHETPKDEEDGSLAGSVGKVGGDHGRDEGEDVGRGREEQGLRGRPFAERLKTGISICSDRFRTLRT